MIPTRFATPADGIAREEAILAAEQPGLLLWQAEQTALVVPKSWTRREGFAAAAAICAAEGWPLIARSSGGGGVPQGLSTVNLALVVPAHQGFTLVDGYRLICGAITDALIQFNIEANIGSVEGSFCDGVWNVTVGGQKLAGTAQRWCVRRHGKVALIHAAILVELPNDSFWRALRRAHCIVGVPGQIRPDAHVGLKTILTDAPIEPVFSALLNVSKDCLAADERTVFRTLSPDCQTNSMAERSATLCKSPSSP